MAGVGRETTASRLVAAFELSAVQLIRGAIRTADLSSGRGTSATPLGPDPNPPVGRSGGSGGFPGRSEPVYERRAHIHPTPRYEQRTVYYSVQYKARFEQAANDAAACACPLPFAVAGPAASPCPTAGLIPPVWKTLPPVEHPTPVRRIVTITRHRTGARHAGLVVDVHV